MSFQKASGSFQEPLGLSERPLGFSKTLELRTGAGSLGPCRAIGSFPRASQEAVWGLPRSPRPLHHREEARKLSQANLHTEEEPMLPPFLFRGMFRAKGNCCFAHVKSMLGNAMETQTQASASKHQPRCADLQPQPPLTDTSADALCLK